MNNNDVTTVIHQVIDMMNSLSVKTFTVPPQTLIGAGSITKVGEALVERRVKKVFIAIDKFLHGIGLAEGMYRALEANNIAYVDFLQEQGEPDTDLVSLMVEKLLATECDAVIAFGGGSVIDALKGALTFAANQHLAVNEVNGAKNLNLHQQIFVAIPTTAGTGSEATNVTVITDSKTGIKHVFGHPSLIPDIAIMDACLTLPLPAHVTAATGIDALTHAIEAYVGLQETPLTQALAHRAISLIGKALPIAVGQGDNIQAREDMMLASYMAGIAFSNAGLGLSHAMAHRIGPAYNIAHGAANAIILPSIMAFNALVCKKAYGEVGLALTGQIISCDDTIAAIQTLICDLGLPKNLKEVGGNPEDFEGFAEVALTDICLTTNPRKVDKKQIVQVYHHALNR